MSAEKSNRSPGAEAPVDGRSVRWEDHKAARRNQVLDAAMAAIDQEGAGVGVQQIAARAGLPRSVVYRLFRERGDLDEQVRGHIVSTLMMSLAPALAPEGTAQSAIERAVNTYVSWIADHPNLHHFLGSGSKRKPATVSKVVTGTKTAIGLYITDVFATALRRAKADESGAETIAFAVIGLVDAAVNRWLSNRKRSTPKEKLAELVSRSVWHVIQGSLSDLGIELDPETPLSELTGDIRPLLIAQ
ncbi:TetR/AcrR family transcriptional regulator [Hoyosella sp. YIM 151337]|uniref:TetR/AcrR family transcriptional regulator n=1 Tax=Hoyosella sp. YIM 151337 TaxID=2992742 RepID=UPI002235C14B|nr:TetR/AcrR family transcriptional regulator [Hoyosella sp. YIM 151337]MCW4352841.1 TetR/AcrR family transcriptional regulator [Hoyosella sp. YIM 151337]